MKPPKFWRTITPEDAKSHTFKHVFACPECESMDLTFSAVSMWVPGEGWKVVAVQDHNSATCRQCDKRITPIQGWVDVNE